MGNRTCGGTGKCFYISTRVQDYMCVSFGNCLIKPGGLTLFMSVKFRVVVCISVLKSCVFCAGMCAWVV